MSNPVVVANLPQKQVLLGDILQVLKILVKSSKTYSKELSENFGLQIFAGMHRYFKGHFKGIPDFCSIYELNEAIKEVTSYKIKVLNPNLKNLLPKKDNVVGLINKDFLDSCNTDIWESVYLGFYKVLSSKADLSSLYINFQNEKIIQWYGFIDKATIQSDFDKWLKIYKIGCCSNSIKEEKRILLKVEFNKIG